MMLRMAKKRTSKPRTFTPEQIKAIRAEKGLSQADAAARVGVSQSVWSAWERGAVRPSKSTCILLDLLTRNIL